MIYICKCRSLIDHCRNMKRTESPLRSLQMSEFSVILFIYDFQTLNIYIYINIYVVLHKQWYVIEVNVESFIVRFSKSRNLVKKFS